MPLCLASGFRIVGGTKANHFPISVRSEEGVSQIYGALRGWISCPSTRFFAAGFALSLSCGAATGQPFQPQTTPTPDFTKTVIQTTDLGHRTYLLQGDGGNVVLAVGDGGIIMVDDSFAPLHDKIKAAVAKISSAPIRYLALTHFHRDHTGGDAQFAKDGATIVAHTSVAEHLAAGSHNGVTGNVMAPEPPAALPKQTYSDSTTLQIPGVTAKLEHIPNAHTDGDTTVYFPDANVLATGDIVTFGRFPNIDYLYGGSIDGVIKGVDAVLRLAKDDTKVVPGHGPLGTKAMIREYRQMLVTVRGRIQSLIDAGKTEDEIVAAKPNADYDAQLKVSAQAAGNFVRVVYRSLKK
jgi:glyoxylase-like metal-dependent hydrolase (beta-lactamase superfamily II)